jgi:hypothetical protein
MTGTVEDSKALLDKDNASPLAEPPSPDRQRLFVEPAPAARVADRPTDFDSALGTAGFAPNGELDLIARLGRRGSE